MSDQKPHCRDCRFFFSPSPANAPLLARRHECRRYPAVHDATHANAQWPKVVGDDTDWCGEFQPGPGPHA